ARHQPRQGAYLADHATARRPAFVTQNQRAPIVHGAHVRVRRARAGLGKGEPLHGPGDRGARSLLPRPAHRLGAEPKQLWAHAALASARALPLGAGRSPERLRPRLEPDTGAVRLVPDGRAQLVVLEWLV